MSEHQDDVSILIVDDRPDKVLALEAALEEIGLRVVRAYNGREALRQVLQDEFAVILLDVNMPDMDGFETASLIRQRRSSRDTPIIFITSFGDEIHEARGYQLGAVDYILAPVVPEVLRTKVSVFVDLFRKTRQLKRQTETLGHRAAQLQRLSAAALAINSPGQSARGVLQTITDAARDVVGAHQAITLLFGPLEGERAGATTAVSSFSERYAEWRTRPLQLDAVATSIVAQSRSATRLTESELRDHPDWEIVKRVDMPAVAGGMLAAPLTTRDGTNIGVLYLSDCTNGEFTRDDEAVLVQLAQMASIAVENMLFAREREANRVKDEFLATLSHELRTPLGAILGWSQVLKRREPTTEVKQGLDVIERNVRSQLKLIEDLLDVSRITAGTLRVSKRVTAFAPIVAAAIEAVRPVAESKGVELVEAIEIDVDTVLGDADRLQQVVWNLLNNAVKFTPSGGRVTARLTSDSAMLTLRVTDSGCGISQAFLGKVFEPFRQADSSSKRSQSGLGIGLTIVRHLVELHGGSVTAHSDGEGKGATFTVSLPLQVSAVRGDGDTPQPPFSLTEEASETPRLEGLRVLLVEDVSDAREIFRRVLSEAGAEVDTAECASEALDRFQTLRPDVLVSDIAMPGQDGYDLIRLIRDLPPERGGCTPSLALTAYARDDDRLRALAAGFQMHVAKPVDPTRLIEAVAALSRGPAARVAATPA
ncbi:MAG: response regulator [Tepidisphaeraceae bacterium]